MPSSFGAVDIPILAKLTWDLHNQCLLLSKDGPDGFKKLVTELGSLQGTLRTFGGESGSNLSLLEKMDEDRKKALQRSLGACFTTLHGLKELLARFQGLASGDGHNLWKRIKWVTQRTHVEDIRSKIMIHTCNLSLCISSIGNASLDRIEKSMAIAIREDEQIVFSTEPSPVRETDSIVSPMTPDAVELPANDEHVNTQQIRTKIAELDGHKVSIGSESKFKHTSTSSESAITGSETSFCNEACPTSWLSLNTSPLLMTQGSNHPRARSEQLLLGGSIDERTLDREAWSNYGYMDEKQVASHGGDIGYNYDGHPRVTEAVTSAMQHLHHVRHQEQISRPIRVESQNQLHRPPPEILKLFETSVRYEMQIRRLIAKDWLRVATWWLLKARATLANCNRHIFSSARGSLTPSTESRSNGNQAYLDILKASYVLYDIVLAEAASPAPLHDEDRKCMVELSESINEELSQYTSIDIPELSSLQAQNTEIWEHMQPEETPDDGVDLDVGLENLRWVAVDLEDAGNEHENVLFRTFVNAGIGGKKSRMRTKGAPYMLLIITREGGSEPKIVLCNQSGTLCLEREFTLEDLPPLIQLSNSALAGFPGPRMLEPIPFKFDEMGVLITFQFETDLNHCINISKDYFDAVVQREPIDSTNFTETVIFKSSVEVFEQLNTPAMKSMNPPVMFKSCEVRILERSFGEVWRNIRRMVISSSAAEKAPKTIELFMPLSEVLIKRDDFSRQILLQWSDTSQVRSDKTDGNYNTLHSYVYDATAPNLGIGLQFARKELAEEFERAILEMNFRPGFSWSQPSSSGLVYDVVDAGIEHKQYKAISVFRNRNSWQYSDLHFVYRDTDYTYDHTTNSICFPQICYTDYISTHVDQLYQPETPATFSHCDKKFKQTTIGFGTDVAVRSFLSSLSPLYELLYSRHVQALSTKTNTILGFQKLGKGGVELQLWRRGSTFQLAARLGGNVSDKWLTMAVPAAFNDTSKERTRVILPRSPYLRGKTLDMMNVMARGPKSPNIKNKEAAFSISFQASEEMDFSLF
ncbi:hypothetical protein N7541_005716 [Penicillium brevicompactum]|uniref:Fungal N-terminal domain-containing protein n=1 Tax=Penicillium brevicompactum TaxID=5074 RepID=A0A9W9URI5_PENBR|nr:hypothetical protein N7541_005716 [Penicillium brevicompactum]